MEYGTLFFLKMIIICYLFFDSYKAVLLGIPIGFETYRHLKKSKIERREKELVIQFREMIQTFSTSLSAGYSLEKALVIARKDMTLVFEKDALIFEEMDRIIRGVEMNIPIENLFKDFGNRSKNEDIQNFANVLIAAKRNGGNLNRIIKKTVNSISDKLMVEEEIQTVITAKKMEEKIMMLMPYIILFYLRFTNGEFLEVMYHNTLGQVLMLIFLILIYVADYWARKIMEIKV